MYLVRFFFIVDFRFVLGDISFLFVVIIEIVNILKLDLERVG